MALSDWEGACKQMVPDWLPTRVKISDTNSRQAVVRLGASVLFVEFWGDLNGDTDLVHRHIADGLKTWLTTMRDKCNKELGVEHVNNSYHRGVLKELEYLKRERLCR